MIAKTPMKAIRAKCLDCCCGSSNEVKLCPITDCPLYVYRFGHRPVDPDKPKIDRPKRDIGDGLRNYMKAQKEKKLAENNIEVSANE